MLQIAGKRASVTACRQVRLFLPMILALVASPLSAQQPPAPPVDFEIVSIKRNSSDLRGGSARTLPDGSVVIVNQPIRSVILRASPVNAADVEGLPEWVTSERYDMTTKPPADSTPEQRRAMWQRMFADRFKLVAHVEERERDVFDLVLEREDGRLGPNLRQSPLDCQALARSRPPGPPPQQPTIDDIRSSCSARVGPNQIVSGGMPLDALAGMLRGAVGAPVTNRTGLTGFWSFDLTFSRASVSAAPATPAPDDQPDIFTAVQEQLGLRLARAKATLPVFVVDQIERPSEN